MGKKHNRNKKIILFWQTSLSVCCYIIISYNECPIHLTVHNWCHEDMTEKRGRMSQDE